jgi:hypothetical protein
MKPKSSKSGNSSSCELQVGSSVARPLSSDTHRESGCGRTGSLGCILFASTWPEPRAEVMDARYLKLTFATFLGFLAVLSPLHSADFVGLGATWSLNLYGGAIGLANQGAGDR